MTRILIYRSIIVREILLYIVFRRVFIISASQFRIILTASPSPPSLRSFSYKFTCPVDDDIQPSAVCLRIASIAVGVFII